MFKKPYKTKVWDSDGRPIFEVKETDIKKMNKKLKDFFGRKLG